jgi:hypothetical protein
MAGLAGHWREDGGLMAQTSKFMQWWTRCQHHAPLAWSTQTKSVHNKMSPTPELGLLGLIQLGQTRGTGAKHLSIMIR